MQNICQHSRSRVTEEQKQNKKRNRINPKKEYLASLFRLFAAADAVVDAAIAWFGLCNNVHVFHS